jgi:hypothetical protein
MLLLKQDKLSVLEHELDKVDQQEKSLLFLGTTRYDGNEDRLKLLSEIDTCLADYGQMRYGVFCYCLILQTDQFVERTQRSLSFGRAEERNIQSLRNWLDGNGCLSRQEAEFLRNPKDLVSLATISDSATVKVGTWIEDQIIRAWPKTRSVR